MAAPLSDTERAILRLSRTNANISRVEERIAHRRELNLASDLYEQFLTNLQDIRSIRQARLDHLSKPKVTYRCYLMVGERIRGVEVLHCHGDAEVIIEAARLF